MSAATDLLIAAQDVANHYTPVNLASLAGAIRSVSEGPGGLVVAVGATLGVQRVFGLVGDAWQAGVDLLAMAGEVREGVRFSGVMLVRILRKLVEIGQVDGVGRPCVATVAAESRQPRRRVLVVRVVRPRMAKVVAGRKIRRAA